MTTRRDVLAYYTRRREALQDEIRKGSLNITLTFDI